MSTLPSAPLGVGPAWTGAEALRHYPAARVEQLVERQAVRTPGAVALREASVELTYAELLQRTRRLADELRARGVQRGDLVAVAVARSLDQIIGVLGVLTAGAAYVPVDPTGPSTRQRFMLEDSQPRAIVSTAADAKSIPPIYADAVIGIEAVTGERAGRRETVVPPSSDLSPQDLAYVIYTSGSTGAPKGVLNQHDGISNHLTWMAERFPLGTSDRVLAKTPAVFDVSLWEWFWPLSQGACLVLTRPGGEKDTSYLVQSIEAQRITNIHFVPTMLRLFLERSDLDRCRSLERVFCSGEALTDEIRDKFFECLPQTALVNLYGPTETAVHVTGWVCTPDDVGPVPIGRALPNVRTYIVDESLRAVPPGVEGELLIGGVQVARGYLHRPELTCERFVPDPFSATPEARCYRTGDRVSWREDGAIDFHGRFDSQVQLGGVRVEPGEIEAALRSHPAIGDAAVVVKDTQYAKTLVAYLRRACATGREADLPAETIRCYLTDRLPRYMIPSQYVWLDEFPATPAGKVDRRALADVDVNPVSGEFEPPHAGTETRMARLWCRELRLDRVGRQEDFHLIGGDSLAAIRLLEEVRSEFGVSLPSDALLGSPTLAGLSSLVDECQATAPSTSIVTLRPGTAHDPLYLPPQVGGELFYCRQLARALDDGRAVYGFTVPDDLGSPVDLQALAALLVRDLVRFQPEGPYHLAGYSFSAALAFEMAQQLRASGRTVGVLAMIDYGPGEPDGWSARARTAGYFFANIPHWLRYDILQSAWPSLAPRIWRKMKTIGNRLADLQGSNTARTAERTVNEIFEEHRLPASYRRQAVEHLAAFYRYRPHPYAGQVLLFWARCRPLFHSLSPTLGWTYYAPNGFNRVVVDCNHDNILTAPHVSVIAASLKESLAACDRAQPRSCADSRRTQG